MKNWLTFSRDPPKVTQKSHPEEKLLLALLYANAYNHSLINTATGCQAYFLLSFAVAVNNKISYCLLHFERILNEISRHRTPWA